MMRPLIAVLIGAALMGGTFAFIRFVENIKPEKLFVQEIPASGEFQIQVWRTFDCQGNEDFDIPPLQVQFQGQDILRRSGTIPLSEPIRIGPIVGVQQQANELLVMAHRKSESSSGADSHTDEFDSSPGTGALPPIDDEFDEVASTDNDTPPSHAMRVMVMRDNQVIADQSFWAQAGSDAIGGTLEFNAPVGVVGR